MMSTVTLFWYTIALVIILEAITRWRNSKRWKLLQEFHSIARYPIVGSIFMYREMSANFLERIIAMARFLSENAFVTWITTVPIILVSKLDDIQTVLSKTSHKYCYGIPEKLLGNGMANKERKDWQKTRRLMNPAFSPIMLNGYLNVFNEQSQILANILRKVSHNGNTFNVWPYMAHATIDTIVQTTMGFKLGTQETKGNTFSFALMRNLELAVQLVSSFWIHIPFIFTIVSFFNGDRKRLEEIRHFPAQVLKLKKHEMENRRNHSPGEGINAIRSVVDVLLQAQLQDLNYTDEEICSDIVYLLSTGSEAMPLVNSFLLVLLGIHQEIQQKVYEEIRTIRPNANGNVTMDQINELNYTEQCIKETIRLFSITPWTFRTSEQHISLNDGKIIPPECPIFVIFQHVNENPKLYPDPKQWNPEHFSDANIAKRPENSFVGFGLGLRDCIGSKYAMICLKTQLCYLVGNFHITTYIEMEDIQTQTDIVTRSKIGYPIKLKARNDKNG